MLPITLRQTDRLEDRFGSITYTERVEYELVFLASNSGSTGPGQNLTIDVSTNTSYATALSNTVSIGYSSGALSVSGSVTVTATITVANGASASTTIGPNSSATISLYQKKKKIYYDIIYVAPTFAGYPAATPVTKVHYAGSHMIHSYVSKVTE